MIDNIVLYHTYAYKGEIIDLFIKKMDDEFEGFTDDEIKEEMKFQKILRSAFIKANSSL